MTREKIFLIVQSVICILLAFLFAAGAISIWLDGSVRQADDPLEVIYTPENVAKKLAVAGPLLFAAIGMTLAGILLGVKDSKAEKRDTKDRPVWHKSQLKNLALIRTALLAAAAGFIIAGIINGSATDMLIKAIKICTECVGLG